MKIQRIAARLRRAAESDSGIGIVEVMVALMIFAIIALGMGYSLASMTRLTNEATNRETATNLAAAEIDRVQTLTDPSTVTSGTLPVQTIDGVDFTVTRSVGWVPASGNAGRCGTGGGNLLYKRVNVTVTWPGMYLTTPVRSDSAVSPSTRINDPDAGTIVVSITGAVDASPSSNVTVTITPDSPGTGEALVAAVPATDADGCTFALKVVPGNYTVQINKTGYVSSDNQVAGTKKAAQKVVAGSTLPLIFQYDDAATFAPKYAANSTTNPATASTMQVTFVGSSNKTETTPVSSEKLYPIKVGYSAVAGAFNTCLDVNPVNWSANATKLDGVGAPVVSADPGGAAVLPVPLGVVGVTIPTANSFITAVQQRVTAIDGDPGCATADPTSYKFTTAYAKNQVVPIALPYGTWKVYTSTTMGSTTTAVATMTVLEGAVGVTGTGDLMTGLPTTGTVTGNVVTLDPRQAK